MHRTTLPILMFVSIALVYGCSADGGGASSGGEGGDPSSSSEGVGAETSSGPGGTMASSGSTSSATGSGGGGGGAATIATCFEGCQTASDCLISGAGSAFDLDNYECNAGACKYTGCKSDAECAGSFPNLGYVCHATVPGYPPNCVKGCQIADDCTIMGAGPAYDADNYACQGGACVYTGCNSDSECVFAGSGYVCKSPTGGIAACYKACSVASDCPASGVGPAFDADNYSCAKGYCEYTGCTSDSECSASYPSGVYVCR